MPAPLILIVGAGGLGAMWLLAKAKAGSTSGGTMLSKNISEADFTVSSWAAKNGVSNSLPSDKVEAAKRTAAFLERYWDAAGGFTITSGYRNDTVNAGVGGSSTSDHMSAESVDVTPKGITAKSFAQMLYDEKPADLDQCIYYTDKGHVHIGLGGTRGEYMTSSDGGFTSVTAYV